MNNYILAVKSLFDSKLTNRLHLMTVLHIKKRYAKGLYWIALNSLYKLLNQIYAFDKSGPSHLFQSAGLLGHSIVKLYLASA